MKVKFFEGPVVLNSTEASVKTKTIEEKINSFIRENYGIKIRDIKQSNAVFGDSEDIASHVVVSLWYEN